jgi:3-deoxy-manno-octulosonate cytidylyltransferase (CMP-KDO synthetase)
MVVAVIPARYASTRFPGKPLAVLAGHPLIEHVCAGVARARVCDRVVVATDDQRIADAVHSFGGHAIMTRSDHATGTDRILEALDTLALAGPDTLIVNVQGDEPLIRPAHVAAALDGLRTSGEADWATLVYPLGTDHDAASPHLVKAVVDSAGFALYFSRLPIPFQRDSSAPPVRRFGHIGLYVYRAAALRRFGTFAPTPLEQAEKLEQLRALENGMHIRCVTVEPSFPGVDTPADLERAEDALRAHPELNNLQHHDS